MAPTLAKIETPAKNKATVSSTTSTSATGEGKKSGSNTKPDVPSHAQKEEPSNIDLLSLVDTLFTACDNKNTVTVGDINKSVAKHYSWTKVDKERKNLIKKRLTDLMIEATEAEDMERRIAVARAKAGYTVPKDNEDESKMNKKSPSTSTVFQTKSGSSTKSGVPNDPTQPKEGEPKSSLSFPPVLQQQQPKFTDNNNNNEVGYKELAVSPGLLGLTLQFIDRIKGAVIKQINPACTFRNKIGVGDRIVSIDGQSILNATDLQKNGDKGKMRVFGIVSYDRIVASSIVNPAQSTITGSSSSKKRKHESGGGENNVVPQKRDKLTNIDINDEQRPAWHYSPAPAPTVYNQLQQPYIPTVSNHNQPRQQPQQTHNNTSPSFQLNPVQQAAIAERNRVAIIKTQQHIANQRKIAIERQKDDQFKKEFNNWMNDWKRYQDKLTQYYTTTHADGWQSKFNDLLRYKQSNNGEINNVPLNYRDPSDLTLGEWVQQQRSLYWEGKLDPERVISLKERGFDFEYEPSDIYTGDVHWDNKFRELIEYKKKNLNMNVPIEYPTGGVTLGQWVQRQRDMYNDGTLEEERHVLLEEKGFIFEPGTNVTKTIIHEAWKRNYKELVQFKRDHGHLEVPDKYKATPLSACLDKFLAKQRSLYKQKKLSLKHIKMLTDIGVDLTVRKRKAPNNGGEQWEKSYNDLVAWRELHGHTRVPKSDIPLGPWVRNQRTQVRKGTLSEDRVQKLVAIEFDFDPLNKFGGNNALVAALPPATPTTTNASIFTSSAWQNSFDALKNYVEKNGHANVPPGHNDEIDACLHTWLETQKRFYDSDALPSQQVEMLEGLGVDLTEKSNEYTAKRNDLAWALNFDALKLFYDANGHTDVPFNYKTGNEYGGYRDLAKWIQKQREFYRKKTLGEDRIQRLLTLGIDLKKGKRPDYQSKNKRFSLGANPKDDLFFEHEDGHRRRVPIGWKFPRKSLEDTYVLYHCHTLFQVGSTEYKILPMKMFEPRDMPNAGRFRTNLSEVRLVCSIIDQECSEKGVVIDGEMTEDRARECVRIGFTGLNIPPGEGGIHESWSAAMRKKRDRQMTASQPEVEPMEKDDGKPHAADNTITAKGAHPKLANDCPKFKRHSFF